MSHKKRKKPRPAPTKPGGPPDTLDRTAELVRRILSVPKSELPTGVTNPRNDIAAEPRSQRSSQRLAPKDSQGETC